MLRTGLTLCALACLSWGLNATALPVVLDVPLITVSLAVTGVGMVGAAYLRRRPFTFPLIGVALGLAALVAGLVSAFERWAAVSEAELEFRNGEVVLAGTLVQPRMAAAYAGAVYVHGSGPESRHEYLYYARRLARAGIVGLVYDKRGVAESTGSLYGSDYADYAADVVAALDVLRAEADVGAAGLIAFSEGEWTAPLAALRDGGVAFLVVIGPSGGTPAEQVNAEVALRLEGRGFGEPDIGRAVALNERVFDFQRTGRGREALQSALASASTEPWFRAAEDIPLELGRFEEYAWWRSVMDFDPRPIWRELAAPVLLIKGEDDTRSPPDAAQRSIAAARGEGHQSAPDFVLFANADHNLLVWPLGKGVPPPLFAPEFFDRLVAWIGARTSGEGQSPPR